MVVTNVVIGADERGVAVCGSRLANISNNNNDTIIWSITLGMHTAVLASTSYSITQAHSLFTTHTLLLRSHPFSSFKPHLSSMHHGHSSMFCSSMLTCHSFSINAADAALPLLSLVAFSSPVAVSHVK